MMEYDEQSALTRYIWMHCRDRMTDLERRGQTAVFGREKAEAGTSEAVKQALLRRFGAMEDAQVVEALAEGHDAFRAAVRDRVLRDHPEVVARCPRCGRVLRTPTARQCGWCHHDWHEDDV